MGRCRFGVEVAVRPRGPTAAPTATRPRTRCPRPSTPSTALDHAQDRQPRDRSRDTRAIRVMAGSVPKSRRRGTATLSGGGRASGVHHLPPSAARLVEAGDDLAVESPRADYRWIRLTT